MDNNYMDALTLMLLAFAALLIIAGVVMLSVSIIHRGMSFKNKRSGFRVQFRDKKPEEDDKTKVVIAAAVAAYLRAEEESKR